MARQIESKMKKDIKDYMDSRGVFWSSVQGGAGSKPGDPDFVVCYRGMYIGIEVKTPVGKMDGWQISRKAQIEAAGGIFLLARSIADVASCLDRVDQMMDGREEDKVL